MNRLSYVLIAAALSAGCAVTPEPPSEPENDSAKPVELKQDRVNRALTLSWDNMGRGGAALRQPAYIHVLGHGNLDEKGNSASLPQAQTIPVDPNALLDEVKTIAAQGTQSYADSTALDRGGFSLYEMSRWERYCNAGQGMDEADWQFVTNHGGTGGVPSILQSSCNAPAHTYQDYLAAWTGFCNSSAITAEQRDIVRSSSRPKTRVNPCKAIK
jgi:hypothetical protein